MKILTDICVASGQKKGVGKFKYLLDNRQKTNFRKKIVSYSFYSLAATTVNVFIK